MEMTIAHCFHQQLICHLSNFKWKRNRKQSKRHRRDKKWKINRRESHIRGLMRIMHMCPRMIQTYLLKRLTIWTLGGKLIRANYKSTTQAMVRIVINLNNLYRSLRLALNHKYLEQNLISTKPCLRHKNIKEHTRNLHKFQMANYPLVLIGEM